MGLIYARQHSRFMVYDNGYNVGARMQLHQSVRPEVMAPARALGALLKRGDCNSPSCEKGINTNVTNIAIILGVVIPIFVAVIVLIFLHRRNLRRLKMEDAKYPNTGLDFGLDDTPLKDNKRRSLMFRGGEKAGHKTGQLSMDMNLSSPYLLPPGIQQSQDSIHFLARTFPKEQDPYRTIKDYAHSEAGSVLSFNHSKDPSLYGAGKRASVITSKSKDASVHERPRNNSMPRSPVSPASHTNPFATPTATEATHRMLDGPALQEPIRPVQPIVPDIGDVARPDHGIAGSSAMSSAPSKVLALSPDFLRPCGSPSSRSEPFNEIMDASIGIAHMGDQDLHFDSRIDAATADMATDTAVPRALSPGGRPIEPHVLDTPGLASSYEAYSKQGDTDESRTTKPADARGMERQRGRGMERHPRNEAHERQQGLEVPKQTMKRLSIGARPLPPHEVTESEDPEYRANRIRSFYREYFDDFKEAPPPMPNHQGRPHFEEEVEENFLGDAAYYDVKTNAFVMPYAQPATRRAMTPPPANRFRGGSMVGAGGRGPCGPGSTGGMGRRPRAGSAFTPHPGLSASARTHGALKKRLPPPSVLNTLPTPSKLRDDSFALMNAIDFAPPDSYEERAAGRSQSPLGERRPYQPKRPVASPLVTSFDELAVLPSPHLLRKSITFTNLDFAPPKNFKDADAMSDAGSIRSNRSGISAAQLGAIRSGVGSSQPPAGRHSFYSSRHVGSIEAQMGHATLRLADTAAEARRHSTTGLLDNELCSLAFLIAGVRGLGRVSRFHFHSTPLLLFPEIISLSFLSASLTSLMDPGDRVGNATYRNGETHAEEEENTTTNVSRLTLFFFLSLSKTSLT